MQDYRALQIENHLCDDFVFRQHWAVIVISLLTSITRSRSASRRESTITFFSLRSIEASLFKTLLLPMNLEDWLGNLDFTGS